MPKLIVVNRAGDESTVDVADGLTVMEAIRDNGFDAAGAVRAPPATSTSTRRSRTGCRR
jgi:sulfur carrier protein ThiS